MSTSSLVFAAILVSLTPLAFADSPLAPLAPLAPRTDDTRGASPDSANVAANRDRFVVDRVAVRFDAAETGGRSRPQFIFERELAFEARIEALAEGDRTERVKSYVERHVRAALERHIAEELLAHLVVDPAPTGAELAVRTVAARESLELRVGGHGSLEAAADAEHLDAFELERVIVREARASLYIDKMIAPMLEPSEAELREVHRGANPFRDRPFEDAAPLLRRWYVAERLDTALQTFFQNTRGRVHLVFL